MVVLGRIAERVGGEVVAKLEYLNPGGSVKDRIGVAMIDAAEEAGPVSYTHLTLPTTPYV